MKKIRLLNLTLLAVALVLAGCFETITPVKDISGPAISAIGTVKADLAKKDIPAATKDIGTVESRVRDMAATDEKTQQTLNSTQKKLIKEQGQFFSDRQKRYLFWILLIGTLCGAAKIWSDPLGALGWLHKMPSILIWCFNLICGPIHWLHLAVIAIVGLFQKVAAIHRHVVPAAAVTPKAAPNV